MLSIASKMLICMLLASLLGFVLGYLFCKLFKGSGCNASKEEEVEASKQKIVSDVPTSTEIIKEDITEKPLGLNKEEVTPDNLQKIKGVGVKIEEALNELGIYTYKQIASWNRQNVAWVDEYLVFKGRIDREEWIEQAATLSKGEDTEFSKKFKE